MGLKPHKYCYIIIVLWLTVSPLYKTKQNNFNDLISLTFLAWNKPIEDIIRERV